MRMRRRSNRAGRAGSVVVGGCRCHGRRVARYARRRYRVRVANRGGREMCMDLAVVAHRAGARASYAPAVRWSSTRLIAFKRHALSSDVCPDSQIMRVLLFVRPSHHFMPFLSSLASPRSWLKSRVRYGGGMPARRLQKRQGDMAIGSADEKPQRRCGM